MSANQDIIRFDHGNLCTECRHLLQTYLRGAETTQLLQHEPRQPMRQTAADCFICSVVWADIRQNDKRAGRASTALDLKTSWIMRKEEARDALTRLEVYPVGRGSAEDGLPVRYPVTKFRLISDSNASQLNLGTETSSPATLDLALDWYQSCFRNHKQCHIPVHDQSDWQPTRLMDIGHNKDDSWALRTCPLPNGPARYATLSYRWGSTTGMRLLRDNMAKLHQGLPLSTLPQTFQDAIEIARHLSIRYLWIDALCIIQDSDHDWTREAPSMRYVYSHSTCNIAAVAADDQDSGLFQTRDEKEVMPTRFTSSDSSPWSGQTFSLFDKAYWHRQLASGSLHNRGWVFQECLLAPRVLYFAKNQILWECFHETKCEGFPHGIPHHDRSKDLGSLWGAMSRSEKTHPGTGETTPQILGLWNSLLETYSLCELTYNKDRLLAFSGVAQLFAHVTGDEYLSGLWRSRLVEQLVWRVPRPEPRPLVQHGVPSWSWACTRGCVRPVGACSNRQDLVSVKMEKQTMLKGHGNGSALSLTGALSVIGDKSSVGGCNHAERASLGLSWHMDFLDATLDVVKTDVYVLPVVSFHPWLPPRPSCTRMVGLVLVVSDKRPSIFRRIGQFTTDLTSDVEALGYTVSSEGLATAKRVDQSEIILV